MSRRFFIRTAAVCCLLAASAPCIAVFPIPQYLKQRWRGPVIRVHNIEGIEERIIDGKLPLRLKDFLALVLANNTEIQITRLDVMTAADAVLSAKQVFDPAISVDFSANRTAEPQYTQIGGADRLNSLSHSGRATLSQTLPSGQTLDLGFTSYRSSSNSRFVYFNPSFQTGLSMGLTQPLLQNRSRMQLQAPLKIARTQLLIATDQTETRIADLVANAARQYWDAVQARDNVRVQQLAVDLAQKAYDRDKLALDLGALSPLEIYQSQSQVAQRKVSVIQAQSQYRDLLDGLRRLIGADLRPSTRNAEILLEDDPAAMGLPPSTTAEEAVALALERRPELKQVRRRRHVDDINARLARNSMLPKLDLGVQAGGAGLGGNQIPVSGPLGPGPTEFVRGGFGDALGQLFRFQSPFYGFSLQMTLPLRSSAAEAALADALVSRTRNQYQERQIEQQVIQEVRAALNQLETAKEQIEAAKIARDLAQKNVEAQQEKYEVGGITAFELLDAQNRFASIEGSLVAAYTGYQRSLVAYRRATWELLDGLGVVVEAPKVR